MPKRVSSEPKKFPTHWIAGGLLVLMTLVSYWPVLGCRFIWDDPEYVVNNVNLRSLEGLRDIWFAPRTSPQYYPLVHTTFWIEYQLWGLNPLVFHLDNVLLHAASSVLLWVLLRRLKFPAAFFAAAVFAVHPVMVESVAWVTERKNVLSLVFYLAAMHVYFGFWNADFGLKDAASSPAEGHRNANPKSAFQNPKYYLAFGLFIAALLSKTVTCSFPAAFLLIVWWKAGRVSFRRDVVPLVPFFVIGFALAMVTAHMEKTHVGAFGREWAFTPADRILIAGRAVWFYAEKLVWPAKLTFIYPRWTIDAHQLWQWVFPIAAAAVVATLFFLRSRIGRGPLVAVLFFIGTLTPALGFFNVFPMRYSFVADHFQYHASLGLIVLVAAVIERLLNPKSGIQNLKFLALVPLMFLTWHQTHEYEDALTLWTRTLPKNPDSWMVHTNLGNSLVQLKRINEALPYYDAALKLAPDLEEVQWNAGVADASRGKVDEAEAHFRKAIEIDPGFQPAYESLGKLYFRKKNDIDTGMKYVRKALELGPSFPDAHYTLATMLQTQGKIDDAITHYRFAAQLNLNDVDARYDLATLLIAQRQFPEAIHWLIEALQLNPNYAQAWTNLGAAYLMSGRRNDAVAAFSNALRIDPHLAPARVGLEKARSLPPG